MGPDKIHNAVMARVARGMLVSGIAAELDLSIGEVLGILWDHGDDDTNPHESARDDPTPEQIQLRTLAVRTGWTGEERESRRVAWTEEARTCDGRLFA